MSVAYGLRRVAGHFFDAGYRFIGAWAILTVLDPVLVLAMDVLYQRWRYNSGAAPIGDAFKLYHHFERSDDGGLPGAFLTIFVYAVSTFVGEKHLPLLGAYKLLFYTRGQCLQLLWWPTSTSCGSTWTAE